ncbi:MAG: septum formation initiator family protein [Lentisphaeria bacterium]|nr:septum formation initiator family protein [Lentisphaeria bacterium]
MEHPVQKALSYLLLFLLIVIFGFSVAMVHPVYSKYRQMEKYVEAKKQEYRELQEENITLLNEVHDLEHNTAAAEKVAREKFNLCREGEEILIYR